jgi:hypothetical protein
MATEIAAAAQIDAQAIVSYLLANAVVSVTVTTQSLGAMPSSTSAGTPIEAPAAPVTVPGTLQ